MNIGIGRPKTTPGVDVPLLHEWACRADRVVFSSLVDEVNMALGCGRTDRCILEASALDRGPVIR